MKRIIVSAKVAVLLALICAATTYAETSVDADNISVSNFLTQSGQFDLEAVRQAGFEGSLNVEGFDIALDPSGGAPRLRPQSIEVVPDDVYWHNLGLGMNFQVMALAVYNGDLIAGGFFALAGGLPVSI